MQYASFDQAIGVVRCIVLGAELVKCDIKSAFHLFHPLDFEFLGFSFDCIFFLYRPLPMGCFVSCSAFERFSTFLD